MVPQHPGPLRRPPGGLDHEVAAVGSDDEVGAREHVEGVAHASPGAAVVEHHHLGRERPPADADTTAMGHILDGLMEPGGGQPAQVCVAASERNRRRQHQGAV